MSLCCGQMPPVHCGTPLPQPPGSPGSGTRLSVVRTLPDQPWVMAMCWGPGGTSSDTWAVTGPIWLDRP